MKRMNSPRVSPAMVVAVTALVFAMSGAGYAATQLTADGHGAQAAKKKKKKAKPGPAGPQGPAGQNGTNGTNGAPGSPGAITFSGQISGVPAGNGDRYGAVTGIEASVNTPHFVTSLSPNKTLKVTSFNARLNGVVGIGQTRFISFVINGTPAASVCTIIGTIAGVTECSSSGAGVTIPPNSEISLDVTGGGNPLATDVEFAWTAE
jgi:hypothetical protein